MTFFRGKPELVEQFRAGDRAVLTEVYLAYVGPLQNVLRQGFAVQADARSFHIAGIADLMEVEAACQEVFLRVFKVSARQAYDPSRSFANYLFRIARNWRIDAFRKRRPEVAFDIAALLGAEVEDESPLAEDRMIDAETEALVADYLAGLPARDRDYFQGRLFAGLTQTEAAAALGLTRIQGRRIEARVKTGLLAWLRAHGHSPAAPRGERSGEDVE